MGLSLTASLFLFLGLLCPVSESLSALREDLEGSGDELNSSGSGDGSELGNSVPFSRSETKNINKKPNSKDGRVFEANTAKGNKETFHGSSGQTSDSTYSSTREATDYVIFSNNKHFMDADEIFAAVIAGGVTGVIIGATLSAMLIYKWKKDKQELKCLI